MKELSGNNMNKIYLSYGKEAAPEGFNKIHPSEIALQDSDSAEEIQATNILEKVCCLRSFLDDVYRVLALDKKLLATSGYYGCSSSYVSPLTRRAMSEYSLNWCSKEWRKQNNYTEVDTEVNFEVSAGLVTDSSVNLRSDEVQALWRTTRMNCVIAVQFSLIKKEK